jgi:hypothetical protein
VAEAPRQNFDAHERETFPRLASIDLARGCRQRIAQAVRSTENAPSSAIAMRRPLAPASDTELLILIALGAPFKASSSIGLFIGFSILAIDETFMSCCLMLKEV